MLLLSEKDKIQFIEDYYTLPISLMCQKWNCGKVSILETGKRLIGGRKKKIYLKLEDGIKN